MFIEIKKRHAIVILCSFLALSGILVAFAITPNPGHDWSQLGNIPAFASRWPVWSEVTSIPAGFADGVDNVGSSMSCRLLSTCASGTRCTIAIPGECTADRSSAREFPCLLRLESSGDIAITFFTVLSISGSTNKGVATTNGTSGTVSNSLSYTNAPGLLVLGNSVAALKFDADNFFISHTNGGNLAYAVSLYSCSE